MPLPDRDVRRVTLSGVATESDVAELRGLVLGLRADIAELRNVLPSPQVSIDRAGELTGLSRSTLKRMIRDGRLQATRLGRQLRIDVRNLRPLSVDEITAAAAKAVGR